MKRNHLRYLTQGAIIAALYVLFTYISSIIGLSSGAIQLRLSEALCLLACFTPAAIPGLYLGCLLSNILTNAIFSDIIFGSLATLIGAVGTWLLRKNPYIAAIPPILTNMIVVPLVLKCGYGLENGMVYFALTVGIGELLSCGVLGNLLYRLVLRYRKALGFDLDI